MANKVDILLSINEDIGLYDISLDSQGDLTADYGLQTAIILSLLTDIRASDSEIPEPSRQNGWWGNLFPIVPAYEMGSKLWLYYQARNSVETLNGCITTVSNAFQWFIQQNFLQNVTVSGVQTDSGISLNVNLLRYDNSIYSFSYGLWQNTIEGL